MKKLIYIITLLVWSNLAFAQNVNARIDTSSILIGEQTEITLSANYRVDEGEVSVVFPAIYDTLSEFIEVIQKSELDTFIADKDDPYNFTQEQKLTITSFDSGYYAIPPFSFVINSDTVETEALLLEVQTMAVDTSQAIFDIKGPIAEPFSFTDWLKENWRWIALIIALLVGLYFGYRYFKNKPKTEKVEEIIPDIPEHIVALEKLTQVRDAKLWQSGKTKKYHTEISETLRAYIERRYQVNALEETTSEIIHGLRLQNISPELMNKLTQTLTLADLVKFAKEQPLANENENSINYAIEFVETTKRIEQQSSDNEH